MSLKWHLDLSTVQQDTLFVLEKNFPETKVASMAREPEEL